MCCSRLQSECVCKDGFLGNGRECEAINPCVTENGACHFLVGGDTPAVWLLVGPPHRKTKCETKYLAGVFGALIKMTDDKDVRGVWGVAFTGQLPSAVGRVDLRV